MSYTALERAVSLSGGARKLTRINTAAPFGVGERVDCISLRDDSLYEALLLASAA